ncbi:MAG: hypothetical protein ACKOWF_13505 [Chloroflexota bacterium]
MAGYDFSPLDRRGIELLAWHWRPSSNHPAPGFPHGHVSAALRPSRPDGERGVFPLDKRHLPTSGVMLEQILRMLIEEFEVEPIAADWRDRTGARGAT